MDAWVAVVSGQLITEPTLDPDPRHITPQGPDRFGAGHIGIVSA